MGIVESKKTPLRCDVIFGATFTSSESWIYFADFCSVRLAMNSGFTGRTRTSRAPGWKSGIAYEKSTKNARRMPKGLSPGNRHSEAVRGAPATWPNQKHRHPLLPGWSKLLEAWKTHTSWSFWPKRPGQNGHKRRRKNIWRLDITWYLLIFEELFQQR